MKKILNQYDLGDMTAVYLLDTDTNICGMTIVPRVMPFDPARDAKRHVRVHSLVQAKIVGDNYAGQYNGGESMQKSDTTNRLKYDSQTVMQDGDVTTIATRLKAADGLCAEHTLIYTHCSKYVTVSTALINETGADIKCEMLSSFSLMNISPYSRGAGEETMFLHRLLSKWSSEGRLLTQPFEDLQLEDVWCRWNGKSLRFGQVGSMPVKGYFPFMAVEDRANGVFWGVQMGCPASWQMEISKSDDGAELCGGIADREFGHWMKTIRRGESFKGNDAVISVCRGDIDEICQRLTSAQEAALDIPESEEGLPVIFNEYCTTWGDPSHDNIVKILDAIKDRGIDYFVIDCGWFKQDGVPWDRAMGEYEPSKTLFPKGIGETVKEIKSRGMRVGIWFEFENIGPLCPVFDKTEHMLHRDGLPLTTQNRRFWDMNDPWVKEYLTHKVIDFMNENGFGYIKVDYNDTIGIGCDNEDSLGEGLRRNMQATTEFFAKLRREVDDVVIENCASGGHRLEPTFMGLSSMASFSDAHECVEIPIIAANLHRAILPRQSQIWCVIRKTDSIRRIVYSIAAGMLGRLCLSGDVTELGEEQNKAIDEGIAFYKEAAPIIKHGFSRLYRYTTGSDRHPRGWQAVVREGAEKTLVTLHTFSGELPELIEVPVNGSSIERVYACRDVKCEIKRGILVIENPQSEEGIALIVG